MPRRIGIIDGHPDPDGARFCHALADAYAEGAKAGDHEIRRIALARMDIPMLRSRRDWEAAGAAAALREAQESIGWADHLVIVYPLWLGTMPALLKAFFEQAFRPGFAIPAKRNTPWSGLLKGKSARIVVTMGMPAFVYRWFYRAHSLKSLERNILRFSGIGPIRETLIGMVEAGGPGRHRKLLAKMRTLGERGR